jgi:phospholipid/cholesterol/gamma-HCH transport system substrate-binding protein
MIRMRHTDEWVGLLVIVAVLLFLGSVLEAGVLRDWFRPVSHLRIVLPQAGVGGLSVGDDVEVLGIHAGTVRQIVLNPNQQMYAEADIDQQADAFIRRDSEAVIRRRFGLAGAAYVDISRGTGAALDWTYAVLDATTERAPTDTISAMVDDIRQKILPILDDSKRSMDAVAAITDNLQKGHGTLGRLLTDDTLLSHAEQTAATAQQQIAALAPMIARLDDAAKRADALVEFAGSDKQGVPALIRRLDAVLENLQAATRDVAHATPRLPEIARNMAGGTADLPALLTQTQVTAAELEQLLTQLRGLWLLGGGGGGSPPPQTRLPASRLQP